MKTPTSCMFPTSNCSRGMFALQDVGVRVGIEVLCCVSWLIVEACFPKCNFNSLRTEHPHKPEALWLLV